MSDSQALWAVLSAIAMVLFKELVTLTVQYFKNKNEAIGSLKEAVLELNNEIKIIHMSQKRIEERLDELVRLKKDVDFLFTKTRSSEPQKSQ